MDIRPVLRASRDLGDRMHSENVYVEREAIDGDGILSSKVLEEAREEALGREEARKPHRLGRPVLDPGAEEIEAALQVCGPCAQGLARRVGDTRPGAGDAPGLEGRGHLLQLGHHGREAEQGLARGAESLPDDVQERVESRRLVAQHRVHGLLVRGGVGLHDSLEVEGCGQARVDGLGKRQEVIAPDRRLRNEAAVRAARGGHVIHEGCEFVPRARQLRVCVEAHSLCRFCVRGQARHVGAHVLHRGGGGRGHVRGTRAPAKAELPVEGLRAEQVIEERAQEAPVPVVRDASAVVDLANDVHERVPRHAPRRLRGGGRDRVGAVLAVGSRGRRPLRARAVRGIVVVDELAHLPR
mmetsp:Transcript_23099/g.62664  ORF Transcript_23099/g.62664 Transcript_23099/m.62664 type:complete len:354 (+) Transcript_23099:341-1402(+)